VTVSDVELAELSDRYGGTVGVKATEVGPGTYRLTLVSAISKPDAAASVS
jgi:hypothetical protein